MRRLALTAATLAAIFAVSPLAHAEDAKLPRTITLAGHGEAKAQPDIAVVNAGVFTQGATAAEALAANTVSMTALFAALKAAGIAERDIQTSNFMVQPRYEYEQNQPPKLVGYDVTNAVTITVRDIAKLGGLLDQLVSAGSNQINGISLQISDPQKAADEARVAAVKDAGRKAQLYASSLSVKLGPVLSVSEGVDYRPPGPITMKAVRGAEMASDVPIAGGEQSVTVDVNITWEIQ